MDAKTPHNARKTLCFAGLKKNSIFVKKGLRFFFFYDALSLCRLNA